MATGQGKPHDWELSVEVPAREPFTGLDPYRDLTELVRATSKTVLDCSGTVNVPDGVTAEQVREYIVNEVAKDHVGKTVTVTRWRLTPTPHVDGH